MNSQRMNDARRCMAVRAFAAGFDHTKMQGAVCAAGLALLVAMTPAMEARAEVRLPPLDTDPQRCERGYVRLQYFATERLCALTACTRSPATRSDWQHDRPEQRRVRG